MTTNIEAKYKVLVEAALVWKAKYLEVNKDRKHGTNLTCTKLVDALDDVTREQEGGEDGQGRTNRSC